MEVRVFELMQRDSLFYELVKRTRSADSWKRGQTVATICLNHDDECGICVIFSLTRRPPISQLGRN